MLNVPEGAVELVLQKLLVTCVRVLSCCQMEETRELHLGVGEERQGNEDSQQ